MRNDFIGFDGKYKAYIHVGIQNKPRLEADISRLVEGEAIYYKAKFGSLQFDGLNKIFKKMFPDWIMLAEHEKQEYIFDEILFTKDVYKKEWIEALNQISKNE